MTKKSLKGENLFQNGHADFRNVLSEVMEK